MTTQRNPMQTLALGADELLALSTPELRELRVRYRDSITALQNKIEDIKAERVNWEQMTKPMRAALRHYQGACGNINDILKSRSTPEENQAAVKELVLAAREMLHSDGDDKSWARLEAAVSAMPPMEGAA